MASMPVEYLTPAIEDRAVGIQMLLADRGNHRAPSVPDILIAATAELAGLVVLHDDKDYELIAEITAQPLERLPALAAILVVAHRTAAGTKLESGGVKHRPDGSAYKGVTEGRRNYDDEATWGQVASCLENRVFRHGCGWRGAGSGA